MDRIIFGAGIFAIVMCALLSGLLSASLSAYSLAQKAWMMPGGQRPDNFAEAIANRIIVPAMRRKQLPGLVVGVVKDGKVVVEKGYGVKSFELGEAPDKNTVFYIGSLSKAITAVGAMRLVEHGKLDLDAPAGKYLKGLPESWQSITVKQFMAHQSGIPEMRWKYPTFAEMLKAAEGVPLDFAPGTNQEYNNFNFAVVGKIIEAVSGMRYLNYMRKTVFGPLHMDHTGSGIAASDIATGYRPARGELMPIEHRIKGGPYAIPSGHLQSTLSDLLKFYQALRTGTLLNHETYELMIRRINPDFSGTPGWFEKRADGYSVVSKNGGVPGFHSIMSFVPGKGDAVVMLWTSQKPKGNGLFIARNRLLHQICSIPLPRRAQPKEEPNHE